jgi:DnaJ-class molecular chaperone
MREDGPIISTKKIDKAWKKSSGEEGAVTIWIDASDLGIVGCGGCGGSGHIAPDFDYKIDDTCTKCHGHGWRMSDE